jgi:hypothetical protein
MANETEGEGDQQERADQDEGIQKFSHGFCRSVRASSTG